MVLNSQINCVLLEIPLQVGFISSWFSARFFFYLYGLEVQFFFSAFSKLFYLGCLLWTNIIGRELYLLLRYVLAVYRLLNYMLIGRVYFFSFTIIGQYYFCFLLLLVYLISFHELSLFSLIIRFPLSLVFYLKLFNSKVNLLDL